MQSISDAIESDSNAWQKITAILNSFLSIAEGIRGVVALFDMLTGSVNAHTAATTADTVSTTAHAAVSTADAAAVTGEAAAATANTAAKSGEAIANATASGSKLPFPMNLIAIAAGVAAVVSALAMIAGFATGGVVGGTSTTGDKKFARVNSGEMILNKFQQARLFDMINGKYQPPTFNDRRLQPVTMQNFVNGIGPTATEVNVNLNANARKMLDMMSDVKRVTAKSGKKYSA